MPPPPPDTPRLTLPSSAQSSTPDDTLSAECMQTIAQGIGDIYPLPPQVAVDNAADTEYYLRSVLSLALKFMTHSKQSELQVTHISSALHIIDGFSPLGFRSSREFHKLGFNFVSHGLHVPADKPIHLPPIRTNTLPPHTLRTTVRATWLRSPAAANTPSSETLEQLTRLALDSDEKTAQLSQPLASQLAALCAESILRLVMQRVSKEARITGDGAVLRRSLSVTHMLLRNQWYGVEFSFDIAARIILTCLLGRYLGRFDDTWATRQLAADVLCFAFDVFDAPLFRARALKTIVATLTDNGAPLDSVYGAVLGLISAGRDTRVLLLEPHLPALIRGLDAVFVAAEGVDHLQATAVRDCVLRICKAISVAKGIPVAIGGAVLTGDVMNDGEKDAVAV